MAEHEAEKTISRGNILLKGNVSGFSFAQFFRGNFSFFEPIGIKGLKNEKKQLNLKTLNSLLFVLLGIFTLYYIKGISVSWNKIKNINLGSFAGVKVAASGPQETSLLKPLSFYLESVKRRDIFRMGKSSSESADVISSKASAASQTLKLVGISWSDSPDVMIEDTKAGKTYFVKKGQMVGDFQVDAVYKDKVNLRYGVETIELR